MKINQKGFGVIEGLLVVIAVTLIVGVGFYVVNANKDDKKTNTNSQSQKNSDTNQIASSQQYLEIKELGIKLPLSEEIQNLKYEKKDGDKDTVDLYIPSLAEQSSKNCPIDPPITASLYTVSRGIGNFEEPDPATSKAPVTLLKQFDDFYITETTTVFQSTGEDCAPGFNNARSILKDAFNKAEKI